MSGNTEQRVTRLENILKSETGTTDLTKYYSCYPVRQLMLAEETSYNDSGAAVIVVVATWTKPAGLLVPKSIRLTVNGAAVTLDGAATMHRIEGYSTGATIKVTAVAVYDAGDSSSVSNIITLSGDAEAPGVGSAFSATGGFRTITLKWTNPADSDFSYIEVWESLASNNIETAEKIAQSVSTEFVRSNCGVLETRWFWIRAVDSNGNKSNFTGPVSATTTKLVAEDIPENSIAESKLQTELSGKIDNTQAAVQIVNNVRTGSVKCWRQTSAPASGASINDLWIDDNEAIYKYNGASWSVQTGDTIYDLLKTAMAQYYVKTQTTTSDGFVRIAGFGIFNDASGSEFAVLADKFYIYAENSGSQSTPVQVFAVDTTTTPPTIGINGNLIVDGSITGNKINAAAQIQLGDGGALIAGANAVVQIGSTSGTLIFLDSETGRIIVRASGSNGPYVDINSGDISTFKYINGAYRAMKSLRKMEVGTGNNGATVTLPGYWPSQPKIQVSANALQSYNASYSNQSQELVCYADAVSFNAASGVVTFVPRAYLQIAAGGGNVGTPVSPMSTATGNSGAVALPKTITLSSYALPANAKNIVVTAKFYAQFSQRGTLSWEIKATIQCSFNGTTYTLASNVSIPITRYNLTSEPTGYYITCTVTIPGEAASAQNLSLWGTFSVGTNTAVIESGVTYNDASYAWLRLQSIQWSLAASTQLAAGTLNYVAIAE